MLRIKLRLPTLFILAIAFVSFVSIYHYMKFTTRYYYLQGQELVRYNSLGYDVLSSRIYVDELIPSSTEAGINPAPNQNLNERIQTFRNFLRQRFNYTTEETTTAESYPNTTIFIREGGNIRLRGNMQKGAKERLNGMNMELVREDDNMQGVESEKDFALGVGNGDNKDPYRSPEEMENDRLCLKEGQGYAHFMHMRKAGGSSVRDYLNLLISRNVSKYLYHFYVTEGDTFNVSCFQDQGSMVLVTNLRHPIERILSSYWYEGKYRRDSKNQTNFIGPTTFKKWVRQMRLEYAGQPQMFRSKRIWLSVENYYIKTLTNRYRDTAKPVGKHDFEMAKKILMSFDVVIIMEWMMQPQQTEYLNWFFGDPFLAFKWKNSSIKKVNEELDEETLALIRRLNYWDIKLYEFAKELVSSRIKAAQEDPEFNRYWEVGDKQVQAERQLSQIQAPTCRAPFNDPLWTRNGKPWSNAISNLYSQPKCMHLWYK